MHKRPKLFHATHGKKITIQIQLRSKIIRKKSRKGSVFIAKVFGNFSENFLGRVLKHLLQIPPSPFETQNHFQSPTASRCEPHRARRAATKSTLKAKRRETPCVRISRRKTAASQVTDPGPPAP